jgi:hypothetical protein
MAMYMQEKLFCYFVGNGGEWEKKYKFFPLHEQSAIFSRQRFHFYWR